MASLGSALLGLAFLSALGAGALALAGRNGDERWLQLSRRTVYGFCALLTACVVIIEVAFASNDFSFNIVQQHSSIETPSFYKMAAMWSSQEGSLLLWAWVLSIAAAAALYSTRNRLRDLVPWATAVMMGVAAFFTGLMLFAPNVDPFATLSPAPADGVGLNPLLQHPSMMIHPPARRRVDPRHPPLRPDRLGLPRLRPAARRPLVLHGARLGRLLGLGPGRERSADAVAARHRLPALDHGPGEAGDAEGLERQPDRRHLLDGAARHLPGPLRRPAVDPRLRRQHRRPVHPRPDRSRPGRLDGADRQPPRRPPLGEPDRQP